MFQEIQIVESYKKMYGNEETNFFYEQMIKNTKRVKVVSYKDIPELKDLVEKHIKRYDKIPKECYKNSAETAMHIEGVNYVEGILFTNQCLPIAHGWNVWKDEYYFDLTLELNGRLKTEERYFQMMSVDNNTIRQLILDLRMWGPFSACYYLKKNVILPFGI